MLWGWAAVMGSVGWRGGAGGTFATVGLRGRVEGGRGLVLMTSRQLGIEHPCGLLRGALGARTPRPVRVLRLVGCGRERLPGYRGNAVRAPAAKLRALMHRVSEARSVSSGRAFGLLLNDLGDTQELVLCR